MVRENEDKFNIQKYNMSMCLQALGIANDVAHKKLMSATTEEDLIRVKEMIIYAFDQANIEMNKIDFSQNKESIRK